MAMTLCKWTFLVCEALERQHRALLIWLNKKALFEWLSNNYKSLVTFILYIL